MNSPEMRRLESLIAPFLRELGYDAESSLRPTSRVDVCGPLIPSHPESKHAFRMSPLGPFLISRQRLRRGVLNQALSRWDAFSNEPAGACDTLAPTSKTASLTCLCQYGRTSAHNSGQGGSPAQNRQGWPLHQEWRIAKSICGQGAGIANLRCGSQAVVLIGDHVGRAMYLWGQHDPRLAEVLEAIITPGDVVIDIGANLGVTVRLRGGSVQRAKCT